MNNYLINNRFIILLVVLLGCLSPGSAQDDSTPFKVTPQFPKQGEKITINYDATTTNLKDKEEVSAILYTYADFKWKIKDISLVENGKNQWETSFDLDPEGALINLVFSSGDSIDRGGQPTYSWIINGAPGSFAGWGLMRNPSLSLDFPQDLDPSSNIEDNVSMMWINNEIRDRPESRKRIFYPGLKLMVSTKEGDHTSRIKEEIDYLLQFPLDVVQQYDLQKTLGLLDQEINSKYIDSVETVLVSKYPAGVLARDKEILKLFRETDIDKKTAEFKAFRQKFPSEKFEEVYTQTEDLYFDKIYKSIAYTPVAKSNDFSFIFNDLKNARYSTLMEYSWHFVSIPYDKESMALDSLSAIADKIMTEIQQRETRIPKEYKRKLSPKQWRNEAIEKAAGGYLTYANILEKTGEHQRIAPLLEKVKSLFIYENTDFNELYTRQLIRNGQHREAIDFISESLNRNKVTPDMLSYLKEDYLGKGGKEADFQTYVKSLKSNEMFEVHKAELLSQLINEPIEGFDLEKLGGGNVKLQDQKGKIVVIDMWATWCAPCKKAMPGMEMAVNKYADDENVQFYFLDTQEIQPDYKATVKKFIEEKEYPFTVLFDAKNPETGKMDATYDKYAKAFQFSGIPQKLIIDQKGNLRWRSTGYSGSPTELADELSIIIEYLKAEVKS